MPTTTTNYSLPLYNSTTDQAEAFASYRAAVNGPSAGSAFSIIDTALGDHDTEISALQARNNIIHVPATFISANYYEATVTEITSYTTGMVIGVVLDTTSAGTVTLNINALGTKSLMKVDETGAYINIEGADLGINRVYLFKYDGTRFIWINAASAGQINVEGTAGNFLHVGANNEIEVSASAPASFTVPTHDHIGGDGNPITEGALSLSDVTTNDASTTKHGLMPKIPAETSITGAIGLTSANLSDSLASLKWHFCTGTTADYTITLPTAVGVTNKYLALKMSPALTVFVVLDGDGTETIDGALTRIMWAKEYCVLKSDGANWFKVEGMSYPMLCRLDTTAATTGVVASTYTIITLDTATIDNTTHMADTANDRLYIKRPSTYEISGLLSWATGGTPTATQNLGVIYLNGVLTYYGSGDGCAALELASNQFGIFANFVPGDYIEMWGFHNSAGTKNTRGAGFNYLQIKEIITW